MYVQVLEDISMQDVDRRMEAHVHITGPAQEPFGDPAQVTLFTNVTVAKCQIPSSSNKASCISEYTLRQWQPIRRPGPVLLKVQMS